MDKKDLISLIDRLYVHCSHKDSNLGYRVCDFCNVAMGKNWIPKGFYVNLESLMIPDNTPEHFKGCPITAVKELVKNNGE